MKTKKKKTILKTAFIGTFNEIRKSPQKAASNIGLQAISDLSFLIALSLALWFFFNKIVMEKFQSLIIIMTEVLEGIARHGPEFDLLQHSADVNALISSIFSLLAWLAITVFLAHSLFQGISWLIAARYSSKRLNFKNYMLRFAGASAFWFSFSLIILSLAARPLINSQAFASETNNTLFIILFLIAAMSVIMYFSIISYTLIQKNKTLISIRKSFQIGIKQPYFLFALLLFLAGFIAINLALIFASLASLFLMIILGILLILPYIAIARIIFLQISDEIQKQF